MDDAGAVLKAVPTRRVDPRGERARDTEARPTRADGQCDAGFAYPRGRGPDALVDRTSRADERAVDVDADESDCRRHERQRTVAGAAPALKAAASPAASSPTITCTTRSDTRMTPLAPARSSACSSMRLASPSATRSRVIATASTDSMLSLPPSAAERAAARAR